MRGRAVGFARSWRGMGHVVVGVSAGRVARVELAPAWVGISGVRSLWGALQA